IEDAEAFVALTGIDEENILLTLHAKKVSNAKVVTKINRITFTEVIDNLDLGSVIYPKYITSEAIIAYVRARKASKCSNVETLYHMFNHRVEAIEFKAQEESAVTNIAFKDMHLKKDLLVACIARKGSVIIPSGDDCILPGDTVMIVTRHTGFNELTDIMA
ncbi:MAG: NAD-binding protein, partial [Acutalibacteraceae bacterium]|nr:NAD-binding protein [Acutalibacteraceae bacterium]